MGILWTQGLGFRKDKGGKDDWIIAALSDHRSGTVVATTGGIWAVGRGRPLDGGEGGKGRGKGVQQYPTMRTYS